MRQKLKAYFTHLGSSNFAPQPRGGGNLVASIYLRSTWTLEERTQDPCRFQCCFSSPHKPLASLASELLRKKLLPAGKMTLQKEKIVSLSSLLSHAGDFNPPSFQKHSQRQKRSHFVKNVKLYHFNFPDDSHRQTLFLKKMFVGRHEWGCFENVPGGM